PVQVQLRRVQPLLDVDPLAAWVHQHGRLRYLNLRTTDTAEHVNRHRGHQVGAKPETRPHRRVTHRGRRRHLNSAPLHRVTRRYQLRPARLRRPRLPEQAHRSLLERRGCACAAYEPPSTTAPDTASADQPISSPAAAPSPAATSSRPMASRMLVTATRIASSLVDALQHVD